MRKVTVVLPDGSEHEFEVPEGEVWEVSGLSKCDDGTDHYEYTEGFDIHSDVDEIVIGRTR